MKAYKAFRKGMKGMNNFLFKEGKTYRTTNKGLSKGGFHAATDPLYCLSFITPECGGEYHEVDIAGLTDQGRPFAEKDKRTAITGSIIKIGKKMTPSQMVLESYLSRINETVAETEGTGTGEKITVKDDPIFGLSRASGYRCVAITESKDGIATASGEDCCAVAKGKNAYARVKGNQYSQCGMLAVAEGKGSAAAAPINQWLLFIDDEGTPHAYKVDGKTIKPDIYYTLKKGKPTVAKQ